MRIFESWIVDAHQSICEWNVSPMQNGGHVFDFDFDSAPDSVEELLESLPAGKALVIKEVQQ
jgi:hypothetical protein